MVQDPKVEYRKQMWETSTHDQVVVGEFIQRFVAPWDIHSDSGLNRTIADSFMWDSKPHSVHDCFESIELFNIGNLRSYKHMLSSTKTESLGSRGGCKIFEAGR